MGAFAPIGNSREESLREQEREDSDHERHVFSFEHGLRTYFQPVVEHAGVNRAEICGVADISVEKISLGKTRKATEQPAFYFSADHEQRCRSAVVCSAVGVLAHATAKLAEGHQ